jgi:hypothetical protein
MRVPFLWWSYDLRAELPDGWRQAILGVAERRARARELVPASVTSREGGDTEVRIPVLTVGGLAVRDELPWLAELYGSRFLELAQTISSEPVSCADDPRYGINVNVQRGRRMRYECHVDSNPIEGLLYVTEHPPGSGGETVFSNIGDVPTRAEVDRDATRIHPVAGHLVFFDARHHSHYVTELSDEADIRVIAAMNFYTPSCPESSRPADLNRHLGLEETA